MDRTTLLEIIERRAMENDIRAVKKAVADLLKRVEDLESDAHKEDCRQRLHLVRKRRPAKVAP